MTRRALLVAMQLSEVEQLEGITLSEVEQQEGIAHRPPRGPRLLERPSCLLGLLLYAIKRLASLSWLLSVSPCSSRTMIG